mmetsp:Transcript_5882/g.17169  ORF Transcript_5882/g.17169 Transcript_5882/m.17169 type:complete len:201 (+) Transcript_5882:100-702(+)
MCMCKNPRKTGCVAALPWSAPGREGGQDATTGPSAPTVQGALRVGVRGYGDPGDGGNAADGRGVSVSVLRLRIEIRAILGASARVHARQQGRKRSRPGNRDVPLQAEPGHPACSAVLLLGRKGIPAQHGQDEIGRDQEVRQVQGDQRAAVAGLEARGVGEVAEDGDHGCTDVGAVQQGRNPQGVGLGVERVEGEEEEGEL